MFVHACANSGVSKAVSRASDCQSLASSILMQAVYAYTHIHTHKYMNAHAGIREHPQARTRAHAHTTCKHTHTHTHKHKHEHARIHSHTYMSMLAPASTCAHAHTHTYIHTLHYTVATWLRRVRSPPIRADGSWTQWMRTTKIRAVLRLWSCVCTLPPKTRVQTGSTRYRFPQRYVCACACLCAACMCFPAFSHCLCTCVAVIVETYLRHNCHLALHNSPVHLTTYMHTHAHT